MTNPADQIKARLQRIEDNYPATIANQKDLAWLLALAKEAVTMAEGYGTLSGSDGRDARDFLAKLTEVEK